MSSGDRWLDAVRAQRKAWEEGRRASREAMDEYHRQHSPRPHTEAQARQEDYRQRREAFFERIERERDWFRTQVPWQMPSPPEPPVPYEPAEMANPSAPPETLSPPAFPALPGWDNRWYYQGY